VVRAARPAALPPRPALVRAERQNRQDAKPAENAKSRAFWVQIQNQESLASASLAGSASLRFRNLPGAYLGAAPPAGGSAGGAAGGVPPAGAGAVPEGAGGVAGGVEGGGVEPDGGGVELPGGGVVPSSFGLSPVSASTVRSFCTSS